ncbi:50S ribosomal protein L37ae [Candidatus Micrarchaeota archaeon RBG_16_36_9]|nr:MAG: 50S ribosomal protein L37ae [Candidatus Micrarchaeota archaeon RBG_16_36_9]
MSKKTKKVGTSGRYGVRYGTKTKKAVAEIERRAKQENVCPYCEKQKLKRIAAGIWYCKKCKAKFAGAAYFPKSEKNV